MRPLTQRERTLVGAAAGVALLVGLPALLLPPGGARKTGSLREESRKREQVSAELQRVRAEIDQMERDVASRLYPGTARDLSARMIQACQGAAATAGLRLSDLKPLPVERAAGLRRVPVRISLSSRFPQAVRFLYEVQRGGSRYRVDQLQLTATDPHSDQLQIELRLVGYVRGEEESHAGRS